MRYSTTHLRFGEYSRSTDVFSNPLEYLGPNYKTVLNFWHYADSLTTEQWKIIESRHIELGYPKWSGSNTTGRPTNWLKVSALAYATVGDDIGYAGYAALAAAGDDYPWTAASDATYELIGMHKLFEIGESLTFVPLFDFTGNYELQSLDVKEIETRIQRINDFIGPKVEVENDVTMTAEDLKSFIEDVELFD
jgi:hypothetical protein